MAERVLVTGAGGFVGSAVVTGLLRRGTAVTAVTRTPDRVHPDARAISVGDIHGDTDWRPHLADVDAVVHCAARVHVMREQDGNAAALYAQVNTAGTLTLAEQAAAAGVRRLVFLSSVKVNGEGTPLDAPFTEADRPAPVDDYGRSKLEAERGLHALAATSRLEVCVIRPVLVYGPGVGGNFRTMLGWLHRGVPLPFAMVRNRRSLLGLENLVDLIATCVDHPAAAGATFLAADGRDVSTPELLRAAAAALGRQARLVPVPPALLKGLATPLGQRNRVSRLVDSLRVDTARARKQLGWQPPHSLDAGLVAAAAAYLDSQHG